MDPLLAQLITTAREQRVVAGQDLQNGMQVLIYPNGEGALLALGYGRDQAHQVRAEDVLKRRSDDLERFGAWLPASFVNGSWYVVKRLSASDADPETSELSSSELQTAQELLA